MERIAVAGKMLPEEVGRELRGDEAVGLSRRGAWLPGGPFPAKGGGRSRRCGGGIRCARRARRHLDPPPSRLRQISTLPAWKLRDQSTSVSLSRSCHSKLNP